MTEKMHSIETSSSVVPRPLVARLDWTSARLVEEGLKLQPLHGTRYAADFMKSRMIDMEVALRVLLDPARRRIYTDS